MVELPGKPESPGFLIADEFYPFPMAMRLLDPILVDELTGCSWGEFAQLLDDKPEDDEEPDMRQLVGLIGIAVWQKHPKWTRQRVVEFVQQLDIEALVFSGKDDADPPVEEDDAISISGDRSESTEASSDTNPASTGLLPSEITAA